MCREHSLWLADNVVLVAKDNDSLARVLNTLEEVGKPSGLELSKEKTNILRVRGPPIKGKIGDYNIEKEAKYLGIQVGGRGRDIFNAENKLWI